MVKGQEWEVVGGSDKGGILVRADKGTTSPQLATRLATGAVVEEVQLIGERLHFRKVSGQGPDEGWVSLRITGKDLLVKKAPKAPAPKAAPNAAGSAPPVSKHPPAAKAKGADGGFESWMAELREKYEHIVDEIKMPADVHTFTKEELELFFESHGSIRPAGKSKPPPAPAKPPPPPAESAEESDFFPQFSAKQALQLTEEIRQGFNEPPWREKLRRLQARFPQRKTKDHVHVSQYFAAFETLALTVYRKVLPRWGMEGSWEGVRELTARLETAMRNSRVRALQEEINGLMGLPRDAVLRPPKHQETFFAYRPLRNGSVPAPPCAFVYDEDGDEGHEFLVEDEATGELEEDRAPRPMQALSGGL
eukprot:CAMPEP_0195114808 /NCGR_PEP_ID=MMETSP0448-20130528/107075_1 /TAXON_ID=66468 /ORGANISM="Heterocapsa triquestra, Strain CCMP 448" /LENGTH=363 /DNA_ID=CAMNT_0040151869 /DNA_START=15 /DNA_END=1102 /DNA_ORIENTATION=-